MSSLLAPASRPHVIAQQRLHLRLAVAPADETALHRRVEHALLGPSGRAALAHALDQACRALHLPADTWLTLDQVCLDLGPLRSETLEADLLERLPALLGQHLATLALTPPPAAAPTSASPWLAGSPAPFPGADGPASLASGPGAWPRPGGAPAEVGAARLETAAVATAGAWLFFLTHGSLPPHWTTPPSPAQWDGELQLLLAAPSPGLAERLRHTLAWPQARQRLLRQFSPALAAGVLWLLWPSPAPSRAALARVLAALLLPTRTGASQLAAAPDAGENLALHLLSQVVPAAAPALPAWSALQAALPPSRLRDAASRAAALAEGLALLSGGPAPAGPAGSSASATAFATSSASGNQNRSAAESATGSATGSTTGSTTGITAETATAATAESATKSTTGLTPENRTDFTTKSATALGLESAGGSAAGRPAPAPDRGSGAAATPDRGSGAAATPEPPAVEPPAVEYVSNAGLVLLHPFLPACFEACGWLTAEGSFVSPEAQARAVLLLHFLATGRGQAPEYELRLPRLLCGLAPTAPPPPRRLTLGHGPRAEGRALLRAALAHWTALRNTTPGGLRSAFLQREGKLEATAPGGPQLTVAQLPQDVLLSRLPYGWSLSLVQLPWLPERLQVSWA